MTIREQPGAVTLEQAGAVLDDARVVRAVVAAHRDRALLDAFGARRGEGLTVEAAAAEVGEAFGVGADLVLWVVYRKGRGRARRRG